MISTSIEQLMIIQLTQRSVTDIRKSCEWANYDQLHLIHNLTIYLFKKTLLSYVPHYVLRVFLIKCLCIFPFLPRLILLNVITFAIWSGGGGGGGQNWTLLTFKIKQVMLLTQSFLLIWISKHLRIRCGRTVNCKKAEIHNSNYRTN
jgi:hypothetical protein